MKLWFEHGRQKPWNHLVRHAVTVIAANGRRGAPPTHAALFINAKFAASLVQEFRRFFYQSIDAGQDHIAVPAAEFLRAGEIVCFRVTQEPLTIGGAGCPRPRLPVRPLAG